MSLLPVRDSSGRDLLQLYEAPVSDPLGDENAPIVIECSIMRADEFTGGKVVAWLGAKGADFRLGGSAVA